MFFKELEEGLIEFSKLRYLHSNFKIPNNLIRKLIAHCHLFHDNLFITVRLNNYYRIYKNIF